MSLGPRCEILIEAVSVCIQMSSLVPISVNLACSRQLARVARTATSMQTKQPQARQKDAPSDRMQPLGERKWLYPPKQCTYCFTERLQTKHTAKTEFVGTVLIITRVCLPPSVCSSFMRTAVNLCLSDASFGKQTLESGPRRNCSASHFHTHKHTLKHSFLPIAAPSCSDTSFFPGRDKIISSV